MSTPNFADLAKIIIEWIKAPWKIFTVLFLFSVIPIVARGWMKMINMNVWVDQRWPWIVATCGFSGLFLLVSAVEHYAIKPVAERRREIREAAQNKSQIEGTLKTLLTDEISCLSHYSGGRSTESFVLTDGVVQNLVKKGVLHRVTDIGYLGTDDFSLTDEITFYLAANKFKTVCEAIEKLKS